jgi:phosphoglycerate dehydrogenase-like enzyme
LNKLLIHAQDAEEYAASIGALDLPQLEIVQSNKLTTALDEVGDCNILLGEPKMLAEILHSADKLEWVQSTWAGIDSLCQRDLRQDYQLTGVKDIFGPQISEYVMAYLFAIERGMFEMRENQMDKHWQPIPYRLSRDITIGIIGLGSIGKYVADVARRFGFRVTGLSRSGAACDGVEKVYTNDGLEEFLAEPDYLVAILPATERTKHFINADFLRMMKPSATLINVGRGSLINEKDLIVALQTGVIAAAVMDVFEIEPLLAESPLWLLPNVYITPHFAAASFPQDVVGIFAGNYQRFVQSEPLLHLIDLDRGY